MTKSFFYILNLENRCNLGGFKLFIIHGFLVIQQIFYVVLTLFTSAKIWFGVVWDIYAFSIDHRAY